MSLFRLLLVTIPLACRLGPSAPAPIDLGPADLRVLFIGNSLTYTNDLPGMTAYLSELEGRSFATATLALPDVSLEDHAQFGAFSIIRRERPDIVVLQQGPSSLPSSREHLVTWSQQYASVAAEGGGRAALLMVWPESFRTEAFDAVRDSYAAAAEAVDGPFIPAGESWRAAWARDADLQLYGFDGFHPSPLGTLAAALTVHMVLYELDETTFQCPDAQVIGVEAEVLNTVCAAVVDAVIAARSAG